jgi:hypothetical protein
MMTEAVARKKWCPFAVPFGTEGGNRAKDGAVTSPTCCVASDCMAWRFSDFDGMKGKPGGFGFCGMAGQEVPEVPSTARIGP